MKAKCEVCKVYCEHKACAFEHNGDENICPFDARYLDLSEHDKQIRAEVIAEISREMRMLYGNEYEKKIRADAIDDFKKYLLSHRRLVRDFETRNLYDAIKIEYVSDTTLEQLKEQIE